MGKSAKAKKEKTADFKKPKLKLGKGKKPAQNATDTSFKARSIALPNQSITVQKDESLPSTQRNQNLPELLVHVRHYATGTKKDGVAGLRELLSSNPELIAANLNSILSATVKLVVDEDVTVRRSLLQLYTQIFPQVDADVLLPHASQVLLHVTSALSHIFQEIRIDSIGFLDLLLEYCPSVIVKSQQRVLDGYLSLLNLKSRVGEPSSSTSSEASARLNLSTMAKTAVFKSLHNFVRIVTSDQTSPDDSPHRGPTWFFRSSFRTENAYECFVKSLSPRKEGTIVRWTEEVDERAEEDGADGNAASWAFRVDGKEVPPWSLGDLDAAWEVNDETDEGAIDEGEGKAIAELAGVLHRVLISTFLDIAPDVFLSGPSRRATSGSTGGIELLCTVGQLGSSVYGSILRPGGLVTSSDTQARARVDLGMMVKRMSPYFPFGSGWEVKRDVKSEEWTHELNVTYCEMQALLALSGVGQEDKEMARVREWATSVLATQGSGQLGMKLTTKAYGSLLPTLWWVLNSGHGGEVWHATQEHCRGSRRALPVEFVSRLILLQSDRDYVGRFRVKAEDWQGWLSETLSRLGQDSEVRSVVLRMTLILVQRKAIPHEMLDVVHDNAREDSLWSSIEMTRRMDRGE